MKSSALSYRFKSLYHSGLNFLFSPECAQCCSSLSGSFPLCRECIEQFELIDPTLSCRFCFLPGSECRRCRGRGRLIQLASLFAYEGAMVPWIHLLKYRSMAYLGEIGGALLALRLSQLDWPLPDYILPVPLSPMSYFLRGYNQSELLARACAKYSALPLFKGLKRRETSATQTKSSSSERQMLNGEDFYIKEGKKLANKRLLLIDDVITTGSTMYACAEALQKMWPKQIYGLSLARTLLPSTI